MKYLTLDPKHGSPVAQNFTINEYNFEVVQSFEYSSSILNVENEIEKEIKMRLTQGNREQVFYALKHLRLYKTLIRTTAAFVFETWFSTQIQEA